MDIGDSSVKAVRLSLKKDGTFAVEDFDRVEIESEIRAKEGELAALQEALEKLVSRKSFAKTEVCLSISAKNVNNRFIMLKPNLKAKAFKETVVEEAKKQIPFELSEVEWGYHQMPDRDEHAQVALFAVKSDHIYEVLSVVDHLGLKVRGVQVPGLALYNFIERVSGIEDQMVILDFGEKTSDLIVVHENSFWLRSLPLSGQHITELLEKKFRITRLEANTLKHEIEKSTQKEKLFRVIEPKLRELVVEIKRSVNFRKTQVKDLELEKFFVCGGSALLPGITNYFSKQLKLNAYNLDLKELDFSACPDSKKIEPYITSFGVAVGLAIQGLDEAPVQLNLVPKKYLFDQILKTKRLAIVVAVLAFLLFVVMQYSSGSSLTEKYQKFQKEILAQRSQDQKDIAKYNQERKKLIPIRNNMENKINLELGNKYAALIYREVCQILKEVDSVYLIKFKLSPLQPYHFSKTIEDNRGKKRNPRSNVEEKRPIEVALTYIGDSARGNRVFYQKLLSHPLFKHEDELATPEGGPASFQWSYRPKIELPEKDIFANHHEVLKLRKEKGWDLPEGVEKTTPYKMDSQILTLPVSHAALISMIEEQK